jgi:DNA-binding response OmpR family regulator
MSIHKQGADTPNDLSGPASSNGANHVVLMVEDYHNARPGLKEVLRRKGYRVIDADNGQDAARQARETHPGLLVVDMDVPLLYGLMAARQIVKHAEVGPLPVVVVTHEEEVDPEPIMELGASRDEYVTRLSRYEELQPLLDYLLPVLPQTNDGDQDSCLNERETIRLPILAANAREPHLRRAPWPGKP